MRASTHIILLGGAGKPPAVQLTVPVGFAPVPTFNIFKSGSTYSYDYNIDAAKPATSSTLFCGPGGSDANNGSTWALRVLNLPRLGTLLNAKGGGTVTHLLAQAGIYLNSASASFGGFNPLRDFVLEPCDSSGNVLTTGDQRIISVHDQAMPSFVLVSGNVYSSTYTTQVPAPRACDLLHLNSKGNPQALRNLTGTFANPTAIVAGLNALATRWGHGALFNDTVNKIYYVQMSDNRAPDANLIVFRGAAGDTGATGNNLKITGYFAGTQQLWARNLHLWGGTWYCFMFATQGNNLNMWLKDCAGLYSSYQGLAIDGPCVVYNVRFTGDDSYNDGMSYEQSSQASASATGSIAGTTLTVPGTTTGQFTIGMTITGTGVTANTKITNVNGEFNNPQTYGVSISQTVSSTVITGAGNAPQTITELDCTADWCGDDDNTTNAAGMTTCNASSIHLNGTIVRINTKATRNQNVPFDNINQSLSWNLGCQAINGRTTSGAEGSAINLGDPFLGGGINTDTCKGWFDGFVSSGNTFDAKAVHGGTINYRNNTPATPSTSINGGTVQTY